MEAFVSSDRRRSPRLQVLARQNMPLVVREISLGGCSVESPVPFAANAVHSLTLEVGDGSLLVIRAKVVHTRRDVAADGGVVYVTGLEFADAESTLAPSHELQLREVQPELPFAASEV
jgi:hypothetical protein